MTIYRPNRYDNAPAGTAIVYLATYSRDPHANIDDPVIAALRNANDMDEVARWFGRHIEDGGFSWDAMYLRGPEEPYARVPDISSVFVLEQPNAVNGALNVPVSQYAFVDRQSAEIHATWMASTFSRNGISIRELQLDTPLVASLD